MADAAANQPTISGQLPLYKKPEPLNATQHKGMGLKFMERPFDFLKEAHFVPVTLGEFGAASGRYPIIFLGENRTPVATMGLRAGDNLFVDENGRFEPWAYLPAYVRRYPFVSAVHGEGGDRFTVCVDAGSDLVSDQPNEPFFNEQGEPTDYTQRAIEFVRRFEADVANTNQFVEAMKELELFDQQTATFQPRDPQGNPQGEPQTVATYWAISGNKLRELPAQKLVELRDNTYLGAIYAHMLSLPHWDTLIQRAVDRANRAGAVNGAAPASDISAPPEV